MQNLKTKIVATLGPASDSPETIKELINSGVSLFRFNTKHNEPQWHKERINLVQAVADKMGVSIGIILDLQGPEMRLDTRNGESIELKIGDEVKIHYSLDDKDARLSVPYKSELLKLKKGHDIFIEDAYVELVVEKVTDKYVLAKAVTECVIKNRKSVNLPHILIDLPSLIDKDILQLDMASSNKVDYVALSFVRNKKDIEILRGELNKRNISAGIISKIENGIAIENIDELIEYSDAIMVARGDLGVEVSIEKLAHLQRTLIEKCRRAAKPVITATQMLETMMEKPRPTNAEAVDVANAVYFGSDALMLSGESAGGKFPVKTVKTMARIAHYNENLENSGFSAVGNGNNTKIVGGLVADVLSQSKNIDKIIVFTQTGFTGRVISALRPKQPIIAVTESQSTVEKLTLSYGVRGVKVRFPKGKLRNPEYVIDQLKQKGEVEKGERVVMIHGTDWKRPGSTNSVALIDIE